MAIGQLFICLKLLFVRQLKYKVYSLIKGEMYRINEKKLNYHFFKKSWNKEILHLV